MHGAQLGLVKPSNVVKMITKGYLLSAEEFIENVKNIIGIREKVKD